MKSIRLVLTAAALVALGATTLAAAYASTTAVTVDMKALNGSGETGSATLTQESGGVQVVVTLKNAPADAQPTHIHIGTCGNIKAAPEYALESVVKGTSTTLVKGVSLADLLKGHYAINVHKSTSDLGTYVSCGDIKAS
jgi:Cu/Zn superoxide dismutase